MRILLQVLIADNPDLAFLAGRNSHQKLLVPYGIDADEQNVAFEDMLDKCEKCAIGLEATCASGDVVFSREQVSKNLCDAIRGGALIGWGMMLCEQATARYEHFWFVLRSWFRRFLYHLRSQQRLLQDIVDV